MPWIRGPCRCGFGPNAWLWYPEAPYSMPYSMPADEKEMLEGQMKILEQDLEQIRKRLEERKK